MISKQEEFTNRELAKLLQVRGIPADFEQRGGRKRMDVVAEIEGLRVVLEAETGFNRKAQAIKDADARLRQRLATVVFAVCYPEGVTESNLGYPKGLAVPQNHPGGGDSGAAEPMLGQ